MAKFYACDHCNSLFAAVLDGDAAPACCGEDMRILEPNKVDAAAEKHVQSVAVERDGHVLLVTVGEEPHPLVEGQYIELVALETPERCEVHRLKPGQAPTTFFPGNAAHGTVFAYCNLHGLWKAEF